MNTKSEDRLLGLASAAPVTTIGGELLGSQLLITVGAVGFVISLLALFAVMSVVLAVGVARTPVMSAPTRRSLKEFVDILPALKGEDSPKGIFRLRVFSVLKYAFAWNVKGSRPVVTKDVRYSACSPVKGLPSCIQQASTTAGYSTSEVARFASAELLRRAWFTLPLCDILRCVQVSMASTVTPEHQKSPSRVPIEPHAEHRWLVWYASTFSTRILARSALYVMNCWRSGGNATNGRPMTMNCSRGCL